MDAKETNGGADRWGRENLQFPLQLCMCGVVGSSKSASTSEITRLEPETRAAHTGRQKGGCVSFHAVPVCEQYKEWKVEE